ncbi:hypothetical protein CHS0354_004311 [Potamilus streckersoni]|uniref:Tetraspanin n=1 Tax=Potamilus streckersoni TaxID=2493646 RepID=A0AAE0VP59_9BIVA|nr:hypothetical protein CHS0354_004311 [Potamilus streckersoni]
MGATKYFLSYGRKFALTSNILFGVLSFSMIIAGFVVRFGDQSVNEATLQKIKDSARDAFGVYDLSTNNFQPITQSLKQAFGIFLIVTGIVSAPLVVFGFYTFLRKRRNFLLAYVIIIGCLVAAQLFVNFHFLRNPETVQELMKPYLRDKINEYVGIHSPDQVSLGWNYLMQEYQCCGVDSSTDFKSSSYYTSYCPYNGEYNAVPGCCRTLPNSYSQSWCYYYDNFYGTYTYDQMKRYCGRYSYDSYMWKDGCTTALFGYYYTRNTKVIWSIIGVALIDQICLFVFAIILLRKTNCKVEPATNPKTEVLTTGDTPTTQNGLQSTAPSTTVSLQQQQVISSAAPTQHSFLPGYIPRTSTSAAAAPALPPHQQQAISTISQNQQSFHPVYVPPTSTTSAAAPTSQPVMHLAVPTQSNFYPMQQFLPGSVMSVPTSHDYTHNTMSSTYMPMTTMQGHNIQAQSQTQVTPAAQQQNSAPMTLPGNGMQALHQTQAPEAVQQQYYNPLTLQGNTVQAVPQTQAPEAVQQQYYNPLTLTGNTMQVQPQTLGPLAAPQ